MRILVRLAVLCLFTVTTVEPYSMGAPDNACVSMTPGHGFDPQSGQPPVEMVFEPEGLNAVAPGQAVTFTLRWTGGSGGFKGFMVQVREADKEAATGSFETEEHSYLTCGQGVHNTITHRSSDEKDSVTARWIAPEGFEGTVFFRYSVVEAYHQYWVGVESSRLRVTRDAPTTTTDKILIPKSTTKPSTTSTPTATTTTATTTTTEKAQRIARDHDFYDGCGTAKACFGMPTGCIENGRCSVAMSYELSGTRFLFKMIGYTGGYIAIGLSPDDSRMGGDLTTACFHAEDRQKVTLQSGYNVGYSNRQLEDPMQDVSEFEGKLEDGLLSCSYKRPQTIDLLKEHGAKMNLFDDAFSILLAKGPVVASEIISRHDEKEASSEARSLQLTSNLEAESKILLRLHGAFMIGAWVFAASLGIMTARYFKKTWKSQCMKKDAWFVVHRLMMVATWALAVSAFLMIFVYLGFEWTSVDIRENPHAVLGCVSTGLCFVQPFMAFIRPHPGDDLRPLFNWGHWLVGNSAQIVGIATIFLAVELDKAELPMETTYLLVAFVAFHVLVHLLLTLVHWYSENEAGGGGRGNSGYQHDYNPDGRYYKPYGGYEMRRYGGALPPEPLPDYEGSKKGSHEAKKKALLAIYILVTAVVASALIALVVLAPTREALQDAGILP